MMQALRRYYRGATLAAMEEVQTGRRLNYHFDHQGTVQCLTDDTGAVTDRFASDAWGVPVKRTGTSINRQWYVGNLGYYRQVDQALDYVRARYYGSTRASFLSRDPLGDGGPPYVYACLSPVRQTDPTGLSCLPDNSDCCPAAIQRHKQMTAAHCADGTWVKGLHRPEELRAQCDAKGNCDSILASLRGVIVECNRFCEKAAKPPPRPGSGESQSGYPDDAPWGATVVCCTGANGVQKTCGILWCKRSGQEDPCFDHCLYQHEKRHSQQALWGCPGSHAPPKGSPNPFAWGECDAYHFQALCLLTTAVSRGCFIGKIPEFEACTRLARRRGIR